jgi:hypothetical protein
MKVRLLTTVCGVVGLILGGLSNLPQLLGQTPPPSVGRLPPNVISNGAFGGVVNAYTMAAPVPPVTVNAAGYRVCGTFPAGIPINTGDSTLKAGTAPPLPIRKNIAANPGLVQLTGGDVTGQVQNACFQTDGTTSFWIMQDEPAGVTLTDFNGQVSAVDWLYGTNYRYLTGGKILTLPPAGPGVSPLKYILITTPGGSVGLKASGNDVINNGAFGASGPGGITTIPQGLMTMVQTSGVPGPTAYSVPIGAGVGTGTIPAPPVWVQGCGNVLPSPGARTVSCTMTVTAGDMLVGWAANFGGAAPSGVSGNGNNFTLLDFIGSSYGMQTFYAPSINGGPTPITVTWPPGSVGFTMGVEEYTWPPGAALDQHAIAPQVSVSSIASPTVTTTVNNETVWSATFADFGSASVDPTGGAAGRQSQGTGYSGGMCIYNPSNCHQFSEDADILQNTAGPIAMTYTSSAAQDWATGIVTFKPGSMPAPPVVRAFDFYSKLGVNGNLDSGGSVTNELADMNYLGIKNIRSSIYGASAADANNWASTDALLSAQGVRQHIDLQAGAGIPFNLMSDWINALKTYIIMPYGANMVTGVSGPNEVDSGQYFAYKGLSGIAAANAVQADLYTAMKADPALNGIPVDFWPLAFPGNFASVGDQTANCDRANLHDYYGVDNSGGQSYGGIVPVAMQGYLSDERKVCNRSKFITTETGYGSTTCTGCAQSASEYAQTRLVLMDMLDHLRNPNLDEVYYFTLRWGAPQTGGNWGLINDDGTPKPSGVAVKNLVALLKDPGATAATFNPGSKSYSLTGMPLNAQNFIIAKSSGAFDIMLWREDQIWNVANATPISLTPAAVTVTFPSSASGSVYDPTVGTSPISTFSNTSTVNVSLGDTPLIIETAP